MKPTKILLSFFKLSLGAGAAVAISIVGTLGLSQCGSGSARAMDGPGMIVTYVSTIENVSISVKTARLPSGKDFPNAGSFGYAKNPLDGGKTEGAAPDGRQLPEYVEFSWQEVPYPYAERPPSQTLEEWRAQVAAEFQALPVKTQRVSIRSRVPQDIVDEVMESKRRKKPHKLSDKALWVYFIWTKQGIKFHWRLWYRPEVGPDSYPREGGDQLMQDAVR